MLPKAQKEYRRILDYFSEELYNQIAAINLTRKFYNEMKRVEHSPYLYTEINLFDDLGRKYRRIVINNYIVLYSIDEENKKVYISHIFYGKRNYLKDSSKVMYKIKIITNYVKQTLAKN